MTIQPEGQWELYTKAEAPRNTNGYPGSDDDDDLIEITDLGGSVKASTPRSISTPLGGQPQRVQALPSAGARSSAPNSNKRPIAAVIDLTSSGDEDDEPLVRAPKRQYSSGYAESPPVFRPVTFPPPPAPTSNGANGYPRP